MARSALEEVLHALADLAAGDRADRIDAADDLHTMIRDLPAWPQIRVHLADALVVAPDEVLVVKLDLDGWDADDAARIAESVRDVLDDRGLAGRNIVLAGREIELVKVSQKPEPE